MSQTEKRTALTLEMISSMPIVEPHIHIGATIRPIIALEIGLESGLFRIVETDIGYELKSDEFSESGMEKYSYYHNIFKNVKFDGNGHVESLEYNLEYLKKESFDEFDMILGVLGGHRYKKGILTASEKAFTYALHDYLAQCKEQKIVACDMQLNIDRLAKTLYPNVDKELARQHFYDLLDKSQQEFAQAGVSLHFVNCFNKAYGASSDEEAQKRAHKAVDHILESREKYPDLIAGINCAGSELDEFAKPDNLAAAYARAREYGIKLDVHWGEAKGAALMHRALTLLQLDRFSHGFQSEEDSATLDEVRRQGLTLVLMPQINVKLRSGRRLDPEGKPCLKSATSTTHDVNNIWEHQIWDFMRKYDIKIAIGSDDPELIGISLKPMLIQLAGLDPELPAPADFMVISAEELVRAQLNGIESMFCSDAKKQEMADDMLQWMWKNGIDVEHGLIKHKFAANIPRLGNRSDELTP
jgi:adenosine deaminase